MINSFILKHVLAAHVAVVVISSFQTATLVFDHTQPDKTGQTTANLHKHKLEGMEKLASPKCTDQETTH